MLDDVKHEVTKKRMRLGFTCAMLCAIIWGIWYIPGNLAYSLDPFISLFDDISASGSDDAAMLVTAMLVTGLNAAFVVLGLAIWNAYCGKLKEIKRTIVETKACTKYFFMGAICGGPIAILGTFISSGYVGASFSACAALAYPIVGVIVASKWLGQKMSRRAMLGLLIILVGGISIYAGGMISDFMSGTSRPVGYIGGLMSIVGWGLEGAMAAKGLDVSDSDVGLTIRFIMETLVWWIVLIPIVAIAGYPILKYGVQIFDPITMFVLIMLGILFGFCYVVWYRSFPLLGVGRGQSLGSLYGLFAVIFIFLFVGGEQSWTTVIGGIVCIAGTFLMFTEDPSELECLKDSDLVDGSGGGSS